MVEESPKEPDLSSANEEEAPGYPAPVGRTLVLITTALVMSTALCCFLGKSTAPPETGTLRGRATPLLSNKTGRIKKFLVQSGDSVQVGQPIAVLIDEQLILNIERQQRERDGIIAALHHAERSVDYDLSESLKNLDAQIVRLRSALPINAQGQRMANSQQAARLQDLESQRMTAAHRAKKAVGLDRIREELTLAEAELHRLKSQKVEVTLPSPVAGKVGQLIRKPGERIVPGTRLLNLSDEHHPYLIVEVPEPIAKRFALGDTIPLRFPGKQQGLGMVANMIRLEDENTKETLTKDQPKVETNVRLEIEPIDGNWPDLPLKTPVKVRTSDSNAMSRRVH